MTSNGRLRTQNRRKLIRYIIFGVNTRAGKLFDVCLLCAILLSVGVVLLESVPAIQSDFGMALRVAEWVFTILFTVEYGLRLWTALHPLRYATSFFGVVDLVAILPTYLSPFIAGSHSLAVVRELRLIRVFRVLKLVRHLGEAYALIRAVKASRPKIVVFLTGVLSVAVIFGTFMYLIEGDAAGFTSIPTSIYWAVVTMTTVGYGDIAPQTPLGQFLALCLMITGYAIIAVPTGILSAELARADRREAGIRVCRLCGHKTLEPGDRFCGHCGHRADLDEKASQLANSS